MKPERINWLRAQYLIAVTHAERNDLCRARLNSSRLGFVLRSPLPVAESGPQYETLILEVDKRIGQLDTRLTYLGAYADRCGYRQPGAAASMEAAR